jgi:hypothetical protein
MRVIDSGVKSLGLYATLLFLPIFLSCGPLTDSTAIVNIETEENSCWTLEADETTSGCGSDVVVIQRSGNDRFEALISKDVDDGVMLKISLLIDGVVEDTSELDWYDVFGRYEFVSEDDS